ncbi:MAG: hypothetical protein FJ222_06435 [Lentisphaerae bacterium]|nr:hypothetical protein [Lentisphaerota bacterium]
MKRILVLRLLVMLTGVAAFLVVVDRVDAQVAPLGRPGAPAVRPETKAGVLRIRRMPKPTRAVMVRTPEFQTSVARSSRTPKNREWALLEFEYETTPEWLDSLDIAYSVMTRTKGADGKDAYSLFQSRVTYIDIQKGDHTSCVILAPNTLARFGEPVALAIEIYQNGALLDSKSEVAARETSLPTEDWWKNPRIIDNALVTRREGLLERSKTPFALINMDDYEVVK